jgi:hypothetical protein
MFSKEEAIKRSHAAIEKKTKEDDIVKQTQLNEAYSAFGRLLDENGSGGPCLIGVPKNIAEYVSGVLSKDYRIEIIEYVVATGFSIKYGEPLVQTENKYNVNVFLQ